MNARLRHVLLAGAAFAFSGAAPVPEQSAAVAPPTIAALKTLAKQPLRFEANVGQVDEHARFVARRGGASLFLADDGATLSLRRKQDAQSLKLTVAGGRTVQPVASKELATKTNYLLGRDRSKWRTNVASYGTVTYPNVLDGVDLVFHGEEGQLEYDFVVAPGADPGHVAMNIEGAEGLSLTETGALAIALGSGTLVQERPRVYQRDARGAEHDVVASYRLERNGSVGFVVAAYDRSQPLVIDPVIAYSTYLGGSGSDEGNAIAADASGNVFVVGTASAQDFTPATTIAPYCEQHPTEERCVCSMGFSTQCCTLFPNNPFCQQRAVPQGGPPPPPSRADDMFVAKLTTTGSLAYYTYIGGTDVGSSEGGNDEAHGVAVDGAGQPVVVGWTNASDFPSTDGTGLSGGNDAVLVQLNAAGSAVTYGTHLGRCGAPSGPNHDNCWYGDDRAFGVATTGNTAYVVGRADTCSDGCDEAFVAEVNLGVNQTAFRELGGLEARGVVVSGAKVYLAGDAAGFAPLDNIDTDGGYQANPTGNDTAFVVRVARDAALTPEWATYFGGSGSGARTTARGLAVGPNGRVYLAGTAACFTPRLKDTVPQGLTPCTFPTKGAFQAMAASEQDAFVAQFDPSAATGEASLVYSTLLGGDGDDEGNGVAVDALGHAYVIGSTRSTNFPTTPASTRPGTGNLDSDVFATELTTSGSGVLYSTLFGGSSDDRGLAIAVNASGIFIAGTTSSTETTFPLVAPAQNTLRGGQDAFAARIRLEPLAIFPTDVTLEAGAQQTFTANGGAGTGYVFTITTNETGGTVNSSTGQYRAGEDPGTDLIQVSDLLGNTATARAVVTADPPPAALVLTPAVINRPPRASVSYQATGGRGPYVWDFVLSGSGGTLNFGAYTAGARGNVTDVIRVTDADGQTRTATVNVGPGISISPAAPVLVAQQTQIFTATGGNGAPYLWSASVAGVITPDGVFKAPNAKGLVTVTARDSLNNTASVNVSVGGALAVTPAAPSTHPRGVVPFTAFGGKPPYTWNLVTVPATGAVINQSTGLYTAGPNGNLEETVEVTDADSTRVTTTVTVGPSLTLSPNGLTVGASTQVAFSAAGGSGAEYVFSIESSASGASINQGGVYTAGRTGGSDVVRVVDSAGNEARATINVNQPAGTPPGTNPPTTGTPPVVVGDGRISVGGPGGGGDDCSVGTIGHHQSSTTALGAFGVLAALVLRRRKRA